MAQGRALLAQIVCENIFNSLFIPTYDNYEYCKWCTNCDKKVKNNGIDK